MHDKPCLASSHNSHQENSLPMRIASELHFLNKFSLSLQFHSDELRRSIDATQLCIFSFHCSFLDKDIPPTSSAALYKCSDAHARKVQEQALTGMFVAAAIKDLRPQVLPFMASMVRHYTMVAIAQQGGKCVQAA